MIQHCKRAVELRRNTPADSYGLDYYYDFLSEAYFKAGRLREFEDLFEASGDLKNEPEKQAVIYNRIGVLLFQTYQYSESMSYYRKATELSPKMAVYHANLGSSYRMSRQTEEAISEYTQAINLEPNVAVYRNELGNIYFENGDYNESIKYYEKAVEVGRTQDNISNRIVYYRNLGGSGKALGQWEKAEKAYKEATELEPDNADLQNSFGDIYLTWGKYEKAAERYLTAVKLNPSVQDYMLNLIEACERIPDIEKALSFLNSGLTHVPDNSELKQAIEILKKK